MDRCIEGVQSSADATNLNGNTSEADRKRCPEKRSQSPPQDFLGLRLIKHRRMWESKTFVHQIVKLPTGEITP